MEKLLNIIKNLVIGLVKFVAGFAIVLALLILYYKGMELVFKSILPDMSIAVLANFVLFAGILCYVILKTAKAPEQIKKMQDEITESINVSETAKSESETTLSTIENSLAHIEEEIDAILAKTEENAKLIGEKILEDARKAALTIKENSDKTIENNRIALKNELLRRASIASIEVAKAHIAEELNRNSELHDRMIDESINAIEGIKIE